MSTEQWPFGDMKWMEQMFIFVWRWGLLDMILLQMFASVWFFEKVIRIYRLWFSKKRWLKLHLVSYKNLSEHKISIKSYDDIWTKGSASHPLPRAPGSGSGKTEVKWTEYNNRNTSAVMYKYLICELWIILFWIISEFSRTKNVTLFFQNNILNAFAPIPHNVVCSVQTDIIHY